MRRGGLAQAKFAQPKKAELGSACKTLAKKASGQFHILMGGVPKRGGACESMRLSPCVLVQPDGWARGGREGYGGPCDVTSLSLTKKTGRRRPRVLDATDAEN